MKKILIVDDEPNIIMALEYALKKNNYSIFIGRDGKEAMHIAQKEEPNLIVLDIMMPDVDGFEVINFIRSQDSLKATKVIFLSAKNKASDIQEGLKAGADAYLTNPFSMKNLLKQINNHIKN